MEGQRCTLLEMAQILNTFKDSPVVLFPDKIKPTPKVNGSAYNHWHYIQTPKLALKEKRKRHN